MCLNVGWMRIRVSPHCTISCFLLADIDTLVGSLSASRGVRFRVECRPTTNASHLSAGYAVSLVLTQEKGALSTFKLLYNSLRRDWDLDTPRTPDGTRVRVIPSPALSSGSWFQGDY